MDESPEQLRRDAPVLCSDPRMGLELVDRLVLQLNRIYPQILNDKEAHRFRNLGVPTQVRLADLLEHLRLKGEEACHEFYRGLHIHAEEVYFSLPTREGRREREEPKRTNTVAAQTEGCELNHKGPMFFLSCFSFVVGVAMLYYYREGEASGGPFIRCSAAGLGGGAKSIFISHTWRLEQRKNGRTNTYS